MRSAGNELTQIENSTEDNYRNDNTTIQQKTTYEIASVFLKLPEINGQQIRYKKVEGGYLFFDKLGNILNPNKKSISFEIEEGVTNINIRIIDIEGKDDKVLRQNHQWLYVYNKNTSFITNGYSIFMAGTKVFNNILKIENSDEKNQGVI